MRSIAMASTSAWLPSHSFCCQLSRSPSPERICLNSADHRSVSASYFHLKDAISWSLPARVSGLQLCQQKLVSPAALAATGATPAHTAERHAASKGGPTPLLQAQKPQLEVTLRESYMVKPASTADHINGATTPEYYFLSNLDVPLAPINVRFVCFCAGDHGTKDRRNEEMTKVMKEALQKVLVHYYPLAGRLAFDDEHGRPFIACTGDGVLFVEADANSELAELGGLDVPDPVLLSPLVHPLPEESDMNSLLLTIQVTRFNCGGFVLGMVFRHCLFDGVAASQFLISWADAARGLPLSSLPMLDRTVAKARVPLQVNFAHPEYQGLICHEDPHPSASSSPTSHDLDPTHMLMKFAHRSFCFSPSSLHILRNTVMEEGNLQVPRCTAFQALAGLIYKVRTTAIQHITRKPVNKKVKLYIGCDGRLVKGAGFPRDYLGNAVVITSSSTSRVDEIEGQPLSFAVNHVQEAIGRVTGEYIRSQIDYLEREGPQLPSFAGSFGISSWARLAGFDADFGWGKLMHILPLDSIIPEASIFLPHGEGRKGFNVLLCHSPEVLDKIEELLYPFQIQDMNCS
ncbi:hypothetical protein L7F22_034416 [Adiantum nelumboides]|nr:hypothetical protein [Adiantum nelumboides]